MKRALIAAALLSLAFAIPVFAADTTQQPNTPPPTFEQRKAQVLKNLDLQLNNLQELKSCIQAAQNKTDLQTCWKQHRAKMRKMHPGMMGGGHHGGMGGPMGMPQGEMGSSQDGPVSK